MKQSYKEPIQFKKMWLIVVIIALVSVPWYFPAGAIHSVILGFPLWGFISVAASIVLSIFLGYCINNYWDMESITDGQGEENKGGDH